MLARPALETCPHSCCSCRWFNPSVIGVGQPRLKSSFSCRGHWRWWPGRSSPPHRTGPHNARASKSGQTEGMPRPRPASYRLGQPDLVLVVISLEPAGVEKARSYSTQHLGGASTRMRTQVQPGLSRGTREPGRLSCSFSCWHPRKDWRGPREPGQPPV